MNKQEMKDRFWETILESKDDYRDAIDALLEAISDTDLEGLLKKRNAKPRPSELLQELLDYVHISFCGDRDEDVNPITLDDVRDEWNQLISQMAGMASDEEKCKFICDAFDIWDVPVINQIHFMPVADYISKITTELDALIAEVGGDKDIRTFVD